MEKDFGKIAKNPETDIIVRVDDFGGRPGLTIREFVRSERYQGFTKAGTRIPADQFKAFKEMINSIQESDFVSDGTAPAGSDKPAAKPASKPAAKKPAAEKKKEVVEDSEEDFDQAM